jgi:ribose transport system substrate-binding protein
MQGTEDSFQPLERAVRWRKIDAIDQRQFNLRRERMKIANRSATPKSLVLIAVAALVLTSCSSNKSDSAASSGDAGKTAASAVYTPLSKASCDLSSKKVIFLSVLKGHPTLRLWQQGFLDQANNLGFGSAEIVSPDEPDWTKAVALGEGALATGIDGVVLGFVDPAEKAFIKKLGDKKIPAVIGHVQVKPEEYPGVIAYAAFDPKAWGSDAALAIGKAIGGKGTVAVTEGGFNPVEDSVAASFTAKMNEAYPDVKVLKPVEEGFDAPKAIAKAVSILLANKDVVGAVGTTGGSPVTWAGAVEQTGRSVAAIGPDATRPNLDAVRDGKILGVAAQPGYEEHQMAVDLVAEAICGNAPAQFANDLPTPIIFKEDLGPYYAVVDAIDARVKND